MEFLRARTTCFSSATHDGDDRESGVPAPSGGLELWPSCFIRGGSERSFADGTKASDVNLLTIVALALEDDAMSLDLVCL
jgi:hypothetical protein